MWLTTWFFLIVVTMSNLFAGMSYEKTWYTKTGWLGGSGWTIVMTASPIYLALDLYMASVIASWANSDVKLDSRMEALHRGLAKSPVCCKPRKCCLCCC